MTPRILHVFNVSTPLDVSDPVIRSIVIIVKAFHPFGTRTAKSFENQPMDIESTLLSANPEIDGEISIARNRGHQPPLIAYSAVWSHFPTRPRGTIRSEPITDGPRDLTILSRCVTLLSSHRSNHPLERRGEPSRSGRQPRAARTILPSDLPGSTSRSTHKLIYKSIVTILPG